MVSEVLIDPIAVAEPNLKVAVRRPENYQAEAIEALGSIGGEIVLGVQSNRANRAVEQNVQTYQAVAEAKRRGATYDPETNSMTGGNIDQELQRQLEDVRTRSDETFRGIALATEQGAYHGGKQTELAIENSIRKLVSQTPGFEREIRGTAASVLGYDPTGFAIRQILDIDDPRDQTRNENPYLKTYFDIRAALPLLNQVQGVDMTEAEIDKVASGSARRQLNNDVLTTKLENGDLTADEAATAFINNTASPLQLYIGSFSQRAASGNLDSKLSNNDSKILSADMMKFRDQEFEKIIQNASKGGNFVSSTQRKKLKEEWDARWNPTIELVGNLTKTKFLEENLKEISLLTEVQGWDMAPEVMFMKNAFGDTIAGTMIEIMNNVNTEEQASLLYKHYPWLNNTVARKGKDGVVKDLSNRARAILEGVQTNEDGSSTSTGEPELDAQYDALVIQELWGDSVRSGDKRATSELFGRISENQPETALSLVAADKNSFNYLNPEQRTNVAAQSGLLVTETAKLVAQEGYILRLSSSEEVLNRTFLPNQRDSSLYKQRASVIGAGRFEVFDRDGNLAKFAQDFTTRLNTEVVPIMSRPQWLQIFSGQTGYTFEDFAREATNVSEKLSDQERIIYLESEIGYLNRRKEQGAFKVDSSIQEYQKELESLRGTASE